MEVKGSNSHNYNLVLLGIIKLLYYNFKVECIILIIKIHNYKSTFDIKTLP